jgi:hypothetical protein
MTFQVSGQPVGCFVTARPVFLQTRHRLNPSVAGLKAS